MREFWCLIGRRGAKSKIAAAIACYQALFVRHKLSKGERGLVLVLAMSLDQARVVFDFIVGFLTSSEVLAKEIKSMTTSEIRLRNGIVIATHANSFRSIRGRKLVCCIFDEVCFWRDEKSSTPDAETYTAILPSLLPTVRGEKPGMLIGIKFSHRRQGLMYTKYRDHFAVDLPDVLFIKADTTTFNQIVDQEALAALQAADPAAAKSEWDSSWLTTFRASSTTVSSIRRSIPTDHLSYHLAEGI